MKKLFESTLEDFVEAFQKGLNIETEPSSTEKVERKRYVYGLKGLSQLFGCSSSTAWRIKKSGVLDPTMSQTGKIIVTDADLALDLLNVSKRKSGPRGGYRR